jgi:hypothetical protein
MSFLTGLWNKTPAAAPAAQPNVQQAGNGQPAAAQPNTGSGGGPISKQAPGNEPNSQSPLDQFQSLLTPKAPANKQPEKPQTVFGHVDPAALESQIKSANFVNNLPQDRVQAALGGDVAAFQEVLNGAVQAAFAANVKLTQGMVEHGVNFAQGQINSGLDSRIRDFNIRSHNPNIDNPALQHPVGKSMLAGITQQIANANPTMSPAEVTTAAQEHFMQFMQLAASGDTQAKQQQSNQSKPQETNWLSFLDN